MINLRAQIGMGTNRIMSNVQTMRRYCAVTKRDTHRCKLLVVGGGTGGCSMAWRIRRKLNKEDIIIIEPSQIHYYQPLFTLVAAGIKKFSQSHRPAVSVLPDVTWLRDHAEHFDPCNNLLYTRCGTKICYDHMLVALGINNDYEQIPGLQGLLDSPASAVATIYSPKYCNKMWSLIKGFRGGHAVFTFPPAGGKCPGAAQKIMYLADDYWRLHKIRSLTNITYTTGRDVIFGVPKYAQALTKIACRRNIAVNYCTELVEVTAKEAVFLDKAGVEIILPYNLLHVTPQMSPPMCLKKCPELVTEAGYLDVDRHTLQHKHFPNVYGIGDCTSTPNSKTAAAIAAQSVVVAQNLLSTMNGEKPTAKYNGYGACPMLTSYGNGILAEFLYDNKVWETFPFDQSKERRLFYYLKKDVFPYLYWNKQVKGMWDGPSTLRKIINPFGR